MIVADTNLIVHLFVESAESELARRVRLKDADWRVPPMWRSEFLNVLAVLTRAGRNREADSMRTWNHVFSVMRHFEHVCDERRVLEVAVRDGVSAYDAYYVATAEELGAPLVTWDRRLVQARPDVAMSAASFATL